MRKMHRNEEDDEKMATDDGERHERQPVDGNLRQIAP